MTTRARDGGVLAREIEHTADLGLEVDAPTLPLLFERAGLGVLGLMLDVAALEPREELGVALEADGPVELLHDFLQLLIVRAQSDGVAACELTVDTVTERALRATARGEPIDPARHAVHTEIKGVTYHQLAVQRTPDGWTARIIVDV